MMDLKIQERAQNRISQGNKIQNATFQDLRNVIESFVSYVRFNISTIEIDQIDNAYKNGFKLEIHFRRTLEKSGVKTVETAIHPIQSTIQSYTVMSIILISERLFLLIYIVLKQSAGIFDPRLQETPFGSRNIILILKLQNQVNLRQNISKLHSSKYIYKKKKKRKSLPLFYSMKNIIGQNTIQIS